MYKARKLSSAIALDSKNDKSFKRHVKKIRKRFKSRSKGGKGPADAYLQRGLIYLSHVPPGFWEEEMHAYFTQFGVVTNVRLLRSHKTGNSKGAAFIEFQEPEVAKIAAETMDNYLMFKRRLECKYVEPEDRKKRLFRVVATATKFPMQKSRAKHKVSVNKIISDEEHSKRIGRKLKKLEKLNLLDICQVVSFNAKESKNTEEIEVEQESPEVASVKVQAKKGKKIVEKQNVEDENWSDDSLVISPEVLQPKKGKMKTLKAKEAKTAKEMKKSLKSIQKKDKQKKASTDSLEKIVGKVSMPGKKGKGQLMLDPSLVTQVNFTEQKAKKNVAMKSKKAKK